MSSKVTTRVDDSFSGTIRNIAKQIVVVLGANSDKIRPRLRIIVALQTDGPAMMLGWVVWHHLIGQA